MGITGAFVAVIGPFIGIFADKKNCINIIYKIIYNFLYLFYISLLWFAKPSENYLIFTLVIVALANLFYELSLIFYNSILKNISSNSNLGKSSGAGFALGYIGGILILIICIKIFIDNNTLPFGSFKRKCTKYKSYLLW